MWLEEQLGKLPRNSETAEAIRYGLSHCDGLSRFLADGRIEIDTTTVERSIRPIALNRKNAPFAGLAAPTQGLMAIARSAKRTTRRKPP